MWTACRGSEDAASWSHGWHSDAGTHHGDLDTASIITLHFAKKKDGHRSGQAPTLGLAAVGGGSGSGSGHCDSHLGFLVTTLERSLSFSGGDRGPSQLTN